MSEEVKNSVLEQDPFAIFGTKVEDITSYDEVEKRDWSKTFYDPDPEKGETTALIKLCLNIFDPKDSLPKKYSYKIPDPSNPSRTWTFVSPSTVGKKCPVMDEWFKLNREGKEGNAIALAKSKSLSRKRYRCVAIQIVNDLQNPALNGKFRLLRIPEGMDIDNLIAKKLNPTEDERKLGATPENVFDPFSSALLILRCKKGDHGRDFSVSSWAPEKQNHGNLIAAEIDSNGNVLKYRPLTEADRTSDDAKKNLTWLMGELSKPEVSLKEQWMYQDPTEEILKKVAATIEFIESGTAPVETAQPAATETTAAPAQTMNAPVSQPAVATAVQQSTPSTEASATADPGSVMAQLGLE